MIDSPSLTNVSPAFNTLCSYVLTHSLSLNMTETMNGVTIPAFNPNGDGLATQGTGQIRTMKSHALSASTLDVEARRRYIVDIKNYDLLESMLPFFTLSYNDSNKIDKGSRNSALACITYLASGDKAKHLFDNGIEGVTLEDFIKGSTVGGKIFKDRITSVPDWEAKYFKKKAALKRGSRYTPLEAFERAMLQEILVYTLRAKDDRPKVTEEGATQKSQADIDRLTAEIAAMFA